MANWSNPTITTQYDVFVNEMKERDVDSATMFVNPPTNPFAGMIQFARMGAGFYILKEYSGSGFVDRYLGVSGGGTGADSAVGARSNLGLGTLSVQNSNGINVSGGIINNLSGFSLSTSILFTANAAYDLGSNGSKCRRGYFSDALVIPVGIDKYATS